MRQAPRVCDHAVHRVLREDVIGQTSAESAPCRRRRPRGRVDAGVRPVPALLLETREPAEARPADEQDHEPPLGRPLGLRESRRSSLRSAPWRCASSTTAVAPSAANAGSEGGKNDAPRRRRVREGGSRQPAGTSRAEARAGQQHADRAAQVSATRCRTAVFPVPGSPTSTRNRVDLDGADEAARTVS